MQFELFSEVQIKEDMPEYNVRQGTSAIIVDCCPRAGQEDGYVLEVLDENGLAIDVIAVPASKIEAVPVKVYQQ